MGVVLGAVFGTLVVAVLGVILGAFIGNLVGALIFRGMLRILCVGVGMLAGPIAQAFLWNEQKASLGTVVGGAAGASVGIVVVIGLQILARRSRVT